MDHFYVAVLLKNGSLLVCDLQAESNLFNEELRVTGKRNTKREAIIAGQHKKVVTINTLMTMQSKLSAPPSIPLKPRILEGDYFFFKFYPTLNLVDNLHNVEQSYQVQLFMHRGEIPSAPTKKEKTKMKMITKEKQQLEDFIRLCYSSPTSDENPFGQPRRSNTYPPSPSSSDIRRLSKTSRTSTYPSSSTDQNQLGIIEEDS